MSTILTSVGFAIQKIADFNTVIPGTSGLKFANLQPPIFDGSSCVFYGNSATKQPEGLYGTLNGGQLQRISDNLTTIPDLKGPPTSAEDKSGYIRHAFLPYLIAQQLFPALYQLTNPRPALINGDVVFFAANWRPEVDASGIFLFDAKKQVYKTLALTTAGYFNNANLAQPAVTQNGMVYFSACGKDGGQQAPGVYAVACAGATESAEQLLNIKTAKTTDNIQMTDVGNSQVMLLNPTSSLIVYGSYTQQGTPADALFLHEINNQSKQLARLIKPGMSIGPYTVSHQGIYREISVAEYLLAFNCMLKGDANNSALAVIDLADSGSAPMLVAVSDGPIPGGGGTFNGNSFAMPPATDGTRVAFVGGYTSTDGTSRTGLFVWNAITKKGYCVIDSGKVIDGQKIANFNLNTNSFVNGKLALQIVFAGAGNSSGIFILNLSDY